MAEDMIYTLLSSIVVPLDSFDYHGTQGKKGSRL